VKLDDLRHWRYPFLMKTPESGRKGDQSLPIAPTPSTFFSDDDRAGLRVAVEAARAWLGATAPNPPVGAAALDRAGRILAVATHQRAGSAHAEAALIELLRRHDLLAACHTLCVTLEPCNHHGRTPPCCDAILEASVPRVVFGARDPNPAVAGGGAERLRQAGVTVVAANDPASAELIYAFAHRARWGRPWVTVKRAFDVSGSMIPPAGQKTFTSPASLLLAHRLRKRADAVLTGSGTVLADAPCLTVRHVPDFDGKRRLLLLGDRRQRVGAAWIDQARANDFAVRRIETLDEAFFRALADEGILDVLVEAGPTLSDAILASPWWTERIDIRRRTNGSDLIEPDLIEIAINPMSGVPLDRAAGSLETRLPYEAGKRP
jgi:diaminohydroxyphosphoribosylaminopyrimidine deaminase/5-amino-6-(5-phosphoribosylamino)uracil reductase